MSGKVADWRFDEGSGIVVIDSAGTNNGSITGATYSASSAFGPYSLSFNGTTDYVTVTHNSNINFGVLDSYSVSAWFKSSTKADQSIMEKWNGSSGAYPYVVRGPLTTSGNVNMAIYNGTDNPVTGTGLDNADGNWHHFVGVRNYINRQILAYSDGVLKDTKPDSTSLNPYLNFDGTGDYCEVVNSSKLNVTTGISVAFWLKAGSTTGTQALVSNRDFDVAGWAIQLSGADMQFIRYLSTSGKVIQTIVSMVPDITKWHHYVVRWDNVSGVYSFRRDGVSVGANTDGIGETITQQVAFNLRLGRESDTVGAGTNAYLIGALADVRIYSENILGANSTTIYTNPYGVAGDYTTNLVAHYKILEGSGTTLTDSATSPVNGTITNAAWTTAVTISNTNDLTIGARTPTQKWFTGNIDEVKIFNLALSQANIDLLFASNGKANSIQSLNSFISPLLSTKRILDERSFVEGDLRDANDERF